MKKNGIFMKIFAYTIVAMVLMVSITAALFSRQFFTLSKIIEREQITASYQPLVRRIKNSGLGDIPAIAQRFYENNQTFEFSIMSSDRNVLYATPGADISDHFNGDFYYVIYNNEVWGYSVIAQTRPGLSAWYDKIIERALAAFAVLLSLCLVCAYVFARQMTRPIKTLADATHKMSNLEAVPPLPERKDELGALARDVHSMYGKLKETISKLEEEVLRERELEETQRYFFSAASHELKTPIAAASVLLEGMIENVGDYKNHPKYLRECVKMMDAQSKTITELLEIVNLSDGKMVPAPKALNIDDVVAGMLPGFQTVSEANGQHIVTQIPQGQTCFADPELLQKALSNVILNAVQNTAEGGEIRIWSEPAEDKCRLCVLNTGTRIDEADLPKLFHPFYRADKARSRKRGRSGLGLTIVQKALESMKVGFDLENTPDGVLFWMDLPKK